LLKVPTLKVPMLKVPMLKVPILKVPIPDLRHWAQARAGVD